MLVSLSFISQAKMSTLGGRMEAGDLQLTGYFELADGGVSLSRSERTVFTTGSSIRGRLGNSILRNTKFVELDMQFVDFQTSDLTEADFIDTELRGAELSKAKVTKANFEKTFGLTPDQKADLKERGAFVRDEDPIGKRGDLVRAIINYDVTRIQELISADFEIDQEYQGTRPLIEAAGRGYKDIVELLLAHQAGPNHQNIDKQTALLHSVNENHVEISKLLLENDAHVNAAESNISPLMLAAALNDVSHLLLLIEHKANIDFQNSYGNTALIIAADKESTEAVRELIKHGANIHIKNNENGMTALDVAIAKNYDGIVVLLHTAEAEIAAEKDEL